MDFVINSGKMNEQRGTDPNEKTSLSITQIFGNRGAKENY